MTTKPTPKLDQLAEACWSGGACNVGGVLRSLAECVSTELAHGEVHTHPGVKMVLGQVSYLLRESCGPSTAAVEAWEAYKAAQVAPAVVLEAVAA